MQSWLKASYEQELEITLNSLKYNTYRKAVLSQLFAYANKNLAEASFSFPSVLTAAFVGCTEGF